MTGNCALLERIAEIVREKKPGLLWVAVVCLKYGARKAAQAESASQGWWQASG